MRVEYGTTHCSGNFKEKVKYLLPDITIEYNYNNGNYLTSNPNISGNIKFQKIGKYFYKK